MENRFTKEDLEQNALIAGLGYIVFFIPLIVRKESALGRYCANQGLLLTILMVLVSILFGIFSVVPFIGWLFRLIGGLVCFALLLAGLLCFVQLTTNKRVIELPYIGSIRILPGIDDGKEEE